MSDTAPPPPEAQPEHTPQSATPNPNAPSKGNGFGIASMILGIVTMAGFAIPILNIGSIVTGVAGIVVGIVGMVIKFRPRKAAIAGLILSGLGLILSIILGVIYAAALAGASKALDEGSKVGDADPSVSATSTPTSSKSFKDGILLTPNMKIEITDRKIIQVGEPGNEYGEKPVIAFYYSTTNISGRKLDPTTAFIGTITVYQDTNPNAENKLDIGLLPDAQFAQTQLENIKKGGTVSNAVAYSLDDLTTPVDLVASDDLGFTTIGTVSYPIS